MRKTLSTTQRQALRDFKETGAFAGYRRTTVEALQRRGYVTDSTGNYALTDSGQAQIAETLDGGRPRKLALRWRDQYLYLPTFDVGQADYAFWDKARRGKAQGLELAGLFLKPLQSKKAAWVMGLPPVFKLDDEATQTAFNDWWELHHAQVLHAYEEAAGLGDIYLVVNPPDATGDLPLTVISPEVVLPLVDEGDYSQRQGWQITQLYEHPLDIGKQQQVQDEFWPSERRRTVTRNQTAQSTKRYRNLIGRVPVVHIPNNRGANELFGHPEGEALVTAMHTYGRAMDDAAVGNHRQGRPTPVFYNLGSPEAVAQFWDQYGRDETHTLPDGTTETVTVIDFSSDDAVTLPETGNFKWESPGSFMGDTEKLLGLLFYLILQHTEIPEFIWGNAISSSKASADSQLGPFLKWVQKNQSMAQGWLLELARIVLRSLALTEPGIQVDARIRLQWPRLTTEDGALTLQAVQFGYDNGLLDRATALSLLPLDVDDPLTVLGQADAEAAAAAQDMDARTEDLMQRLAHPVEADGGDTGVDEADTEVQEIIRQAQSIVAEAHDGVMVAFVPDRMTAVDLWEPVTRAGLPNPTPVRELHLTLVYLGEIGQMVADREYVAQVVRDYVRGQEPVVGQISGVGRFHTDEGQGTNALYASVDSPQLPAFRQGLVDALEAAGIVVQQAHGFTPHITLAYIPAADPTPHLKFGTIELMFDQAVLAWGDQWQVIPFAAPQPVERIVANHA